MAWSSAGSRAQDLAAEKSEAARLEFESQAVSSANADSKISLTVNAWLPRLLPAMPQ
jgi:hypothetical protein